MMLLPRIWPVVLICCALVSGQAYATNVYTEVASVDAWLTPPAPADIERALQRHEQSLLAPEFVQALYSHRKARPIWTEATHMLSLRAALGASRADGLLDAELRRPAKDDPFDPNASLSDAEREILLTDTLIALGDRLVNGRADARGLAIKDGTPRAWKDPEDAVLNKTSVQLDAGEVAAIVADMRPDSDLYLRLREALKGELSGASEQATLDTLRVNLERARWFDRALGDQDRVVVNIPAYSLDLHLGGESVWQSRVIVGKKDRRTPVFVSEMRDVVLDPTWTVPRSIIEERLFDEASADPIDFAARGFRMRDARGAWHDATDIDWQAYEAEQFPYDIVQMPGNSNALGRIKFLFDNPYSVYLHDTPSRYLFDSEDRAFSHGCVRVQDPDELGRLVLGHNGGLDAQGIASLYADADNIPVDLQQPLMVGLLYWTVDVDEDDNLVFYDDIYDRDADILRAINNPGVPALLERARGS